MRIKPIIIFIVVLLLGFQSCSSIKPLVIITGTVWKYKDYERKYTLSFLENGVLRSTHPNETTPDNDKWWTSGDTLYFSFNDRYAVYYGLCYGPGKIKGIGRNKKSSWKFTLSR